MKTACSLCQCIFAAQAVGVWSAVSDFLTTSSANTLLWGKAFGWSNNSQEMKEYVAVRYDGQEYNPARPFDRLHLIRLAQTLEKESQWLA